MHRLNQEQLEFARLKWRGHGYYIKNQKKDRLGNPVEFRISFEDWIKIWLDSGHWFDRGASTGKYVMSRHNDIGHYEVGNVSIKLHSENISEGHRGLKATNHQKKQSSLANSKKVSTPLGQFESRTTAAKHYNITPEGMGVRITSSNFPDFYYIE